MPLLLILSVPETLAVDSSHQQVVMRSESLLSVPDPHDSASPEFHTSGVIAASSLEMDARRTDGDIEVSSEELAKLSPPAYPCTWHLGISRVDKANENEGASKEWRIMTVRGARGDSFNFAGCTRSKFNLSAGMCKASSAQGSVRLLRNQRNEVVGFGGCCLQEVSNLVANARLGECEDTPVASTSIMPEQTFEDPEVNMSQLPRNASIGKEFVFGLASGGTIHAALKISFLVGSVAMGIVSVLVYTKYFSAK